MKTLENYERNEKIVRGLSIVSAIGFIATVIFGFLYLIYGKKYMDDLGGYGLMVFIFPFLLLQIAMPANFHYFGINSLGWRSLFFFLIMFPFCDALFITGMGTIFKFISFPHHDAYHGIQSAIRQEATRLTMIYGLIIYVSLISIGFIIRFSKGMFTKKLILA